MFNVRPTTGLPGFRVGMEEEVPGFRINADGSVGPTLPGASNAAVLANDSTDNALQIAAPAAFPVGMFYNASSGLYPPPYRPYDPVAGLQPSQDPLLEQSDRTAKLYAGVGGNPFSFPDGRGLNTNPMVPAGDGSSSPYAAYGDEAPNGLGGALTPRPDLVQPSGMEPAALVSSSPPSSPLLSTMSATGGLPPEAMRPPPFPGQMAPDEGPQRSPASSPAALSGWPASDAVQSASDRTADPNIVRVGGGDPATSSDEVLIAQEQGTKQSKLRKDPSPGVAVVLPDKSTIPDPESPTGQLMAPTADLSEVAAAGRRAKETLDKLSVFPPAYLAYLGGTLGSNVGQGGTFDYQRRGNMITGYTHLQQFEKVSNLNVGLFAQQAGLTLEQTLIIAGEFARHLSSNGKEGLNALQREFITRGYKIGASGVFDRPPGR